MVLSSSNISLPSVTDETRLSTTSILYTTGAAPTSYTYSRTSSYSTGSILVGHCSAAEYELIDGGPTVYYAPVLGCGDSRPDCCPPAVGDTATPTAMNSAWAGADQAFMTRCPDDYHSTAGGCCPKEYRMWESGLLDGQTPCVSTVRQSTTPPPLRVTSTQSTGVSKTTVAIVNFVFAIHYPVREAESGPPLSIAAIAGISIGGAVFLLAMVGIVLLCLCLRRRRGRKEASAGVFAPHGVADKGPGRSSEPGQQTMSYTVPSPSSNNFQPAYYSVPAAMPAQTQQQPIQTRHGEAYQEETYQPASGYEWRDEQLRGAGMQYVR